MESCRCGFAVIRISPNSMGVREHTVIQSSFYSGYEAGQQECACHIRVGMTPEGHIRVHMGPPHYYMRAGTTTPARLVQNGRCRTEMDKFQDVDRIWGSVEESIFIFHVGQNFVIFGYSLHSYFHLKLLVCINY